MRPKSELMAQKRASMTEKEKAKQRQKDKERKAVKRKIMSDKERENQRKSDKLRKAESRKNMSEEEREIVKSQDRSRKKSNIRKCLDTSEEEAKSSYLKHEKEFNRLYKIRVRGERSEAAHEFEKIYNLLCMRKARRLRTDEDHLLENTEAKNGMKLAREKGFLKPISSRSFRKIEEMEIWKLFARRGPEYRAILKDKKPEVYAFFEQKQIEQEKKEAIKQSERDKGFWEFDYFQDKWFWTGLEPPGPEDPDPNIVDLDVPVNEPTEEDLEEGRKWDQLQVQWYKEMEREKRNKAARENYQKRKKKLLAPIEIPDNFEMSEYEKIREQNIREREEAFRAAGFDMI